MAERVEEAEGRQHGPGPHREACALAPRENHDPEHDDADEPDHQDGLPGAVDLDGPVGGGERCGIGRSRHQGEEDRAPHHGGRVFRRRLRPAPGRRACHQPDPGHGRRHRAPMERRGPGAEGDRDRHRDRRVARHHRRGERHRPMGHGVEEQDRAERRAGADADEPVEAVEAPVEGLAHRRHADRDQHRAHRHHREGRRQRTDRAAGEAGGEIRETPGDRAARAPGGGAA